MNLPRSYAIVVEIISDKFRRIAGGERFTVGLMQADNELPFPLETEVRLVLKLNELGNAIEIAKILNRDYRRRAIDDVTT